jgi:hypothetical protein
MGKTAGVAFCICLAVEVVEMRAARLAGVVYLVVAVGCDKGKAFQLLALAHDAPAAARDHENRQAVLL